MNPIYPLVNKGMMLMLATIFIIYGGLYVLQSTQNEGQRLDCKNIFFVISGALNLAISLILVGVGRYVQTQSTIYITNVRLGVVQDNKISEGLG